MASIQITGIGMLGKCSADVAPPMNEPMPVLANAPLSSATGRPCDRINDKPSAISSIASVVINGGRPRPNDRQRIDPAGRRADRNGDQQRQSD